MSKKRLNSYGVRYVNGQRYLQVDSGMTRYSETEQETIPTTSDFPVTRQQAATFATQAANAGLIDHTAEGVVSWKRMVVLVEVAE